MPGGRNVLTEAYIWIGCDNKLGQHLANKLESDPSFLATSFPGTTAGTSVAASG